MFKNSIKNFFVNLKHFFTPLGTLLLGVALGLSVFIPCMYNAIVNAVGDINELMQEVHLDFDAMWQSIINAFTDLDWEDPAATIEVMLTGNWIADTLTNAVNAIIGDSMHMLEESLPQIFAEATDLIMTGVIALVVFTVVGIFAGHFLTSFLVRRTIAKRSFWKSFLAFFIDAILNVALVAMCVWLATLWTYSIIFTLFAVAVIAAYKALLEAYLIQGFRKIEFKKIVNFKNALRYLLCILLIWAIVVVVVVAVYFAINVVLAVLVGLAVVEIALAVTSLNAEAYVKDCIGE